MRFFHCAYELTGTLELTNQPQSMAIEIMKKHYRKKFPHKHSWYKISFLASVILYLFLSIVSLMHFKRISKGSLRSSLSVVSPISGKLPFQKCLAAVMTMSPFLAFRP